MDTDQWLIVIAWAVASSVGTWILAMLWYGRKLTEAHARVRKLEKARQTAYQQTATARKQVEQLQKEMSDLRQPAAQREVVRPKPQVSEQAPQRQDNPLLSSGPFDEPEPPHHGFAETQVMEPVKKRPA